MKSFQADMYNVFIELISGILKGSSLMAVFERNF